MSPSFPPREWATSRLSSASPLPSSRSAAASPSSPSSPSSPPLSPAACPASFPDISHHELHLPAVTCTATCVPAAEAGDPFFVQAGLIASSSHLLLPLLSSLRPSALITDVFLATAAVTVVTELQLPHYVLFTSSAAMLSLCVYFPCVEAFDPKGEIEIPGLGDHSIPGECLPQALRDPTHLFKTIFVNSGRALMHCDGILVNTFEAMESEVLSALNCGKVVDGTPPVVAIGPLVETISRQPLPSYEGTESPFSWLDKQPQRSVIYVSFGSRTALSSEQMRELGHGLERSGCRFLWVVKSKKVDKEEEDKKGQEEGEEEVGKWIDNVMGDVGYYSRVRGKGLIVKVWVQQMEVLLHKAVGGFLSHCGWNSVMEAAVTGVRVLGWPRHGDQRLNAAVVESCGLGKWMRGWSWEGDLVGVGKEEISRKVREFMEDADVEETALSVRMEAKRAIEDSGGLSLELQRFVTMLRHQPVSP